MTPLRFNVGGVPGDGHLRFPREALFTALLDHTSRGGALLFGPSRAGKTVLLRDLAVRRAKEGWRVVWLDLRMLVRSAADTSEPAPTSAQPAGMLHLDLAQYGRLLGEATQPSAKGLRQALTHAIESAAKTGETGKKERVLVIADELNALLHLPDAGAWLAALEAPVELGARAAYATNWSLGGHLPRPELGPTLLVPRALPAADVSVPAIAAAIAGERARAQLNSRESAPPAIAAADAQELASNVAAITGMSPALIQLLGKALGEGKIDATLRGQLLDVRCAEHLRARTGVRPTTEKQLAQMAPSEALEVLVWLEGQARFPPEPREVSGPELFALGFADPDDILSAPLITEIYDATWRAAQAADLDRRLPHARRVFEWSRDGALPASAVRDTDLDALDRRRNLALSEADYRQALSTEQRRAVSGRRIVTYAALATAMVVVVVSVMIYFAAENTKNGDRARLAEAGLDQASMELAAANQRNEDIVRDREEGVRRHRSELEELRRHHEEAAAQLREAERRAREDLEARHHARYVACNSDRDRVQLSLREAQREVARLGEELARLVASQRGGEPRRRSATGDVGVQPP